MSEPQFRHLHCQLEAGIPVLVLTDSRLQGDELAESLRQELFAAADQFGAPKLVIDFRQVAYMSSSGFRPLLSLFRKLQGKRGRMVFCNLAPEVAEVFLVTRLISSSRFFTAPFETARDVPEALARLRRHVPRLEQDVLVLTVTEKELTGEELAADLGQELQASVDQAGVSKVVLDLQNVIYLFTPCLRPMLALRNHLRSLGGRIVLCNLKMRVEEVLRVTRLISGGGGGPVPFEAAADVPAALSLLQNPAAPPASQEQ